MIDSGADANIISESDYANIRKSVDNGEGAMFDITRQPRISITGYAAASKLVVVCSFKAWIDVVLDTKKPRTFAEFFVVKGGGKSLIGRATSTAMKVLAVGTQVNAVTIEDIGVDITEDEFPSIPGVEVDFDIDENVPGKHRSYISIPAHFYDPAIKRLEEMCRRKIIEKVDKPGDWVSGLSAVPKGKGDMRLVVNMTGPNTAITRRVHPMPRFEEIQLKLFGCIIFTKLDLSSAFFHLRLSERSKDMTTFLAPSITGTQMYRFCRLVFGVNCAPEIFQQEMERILQGINNIVVYIDDILIAAKSPEELQATTEAVLERLRANNLTLNESKCEYAKESLTFLGHRVSSNGFDIDAQKVKDIDCFRAPRNSTELKSFLGLANFVRNFIPNFAELTHPLRVVDGKGKFAWKKEQQEAFGKVKRQISECTTSQGFFSTSDKTIIYTDASPHGPDYQLRFEKPHTNRAALPTSPAGSIGGSMGSGTLPLLHAGS
jgi:Reverse transcriptase (RNA-dependent DNA polymerase)